ncbi:hypothetical protein MCOR25_007548 [Pyricularia grisea]|nr:hypothetical protein MCOR25_007548 [Pyricularia grisea]
MAEAVGLAVSCLELAGYVPKGIRLVKSIKDTPEDIRKKQQEVAQYAASILKVVETPGLDADIRKRLLSSSGAYQNAMKELHDLLQPLFLKGREGKLKKYLSSAEAVWKKEDLKEAFDKVLRAQNVWMGEMPMVAASQIKENLARAEAVLAKTLVYAERVETVVADIQEDMEEMKIEFQDINLRLQHINLQLSNQAAVKSNLQISCSVNNNGHSTSSTAVELAKYKTALRRRRKAQMNDKDCDCAVSETRWAIMNDHFVSESLQTHNRDCPWYEGGYKTWSYWVRLPSWKYSRWLTIQSSGTGPQSILPVLQMPRQVRRSESPIFDALDDFRASVDWMRDWDVYLGRVPDGFGLPRPERIPDNNHLPRLERCRTVIEFELRRRRRALPTDVDENGQSAWQAVLELGALALAGHHDELLPGLVGLLTLLLEHDVDPDREYHGPAALRLKSLWNVAIKRAHGSFLFERITPLQQFRLPGYSELERLGFVEEGGRTDSILHLPSLTWRSIVRRHPDLLDDLGLPAISVQLLLTPTLDEFKSQNSHEKIRNWDLSNSWESKRAILGWKEAMHYLAEAGCAFEGALGDACSQNDVDIVRTLLQTARLPIEASDLDGAFQATNMDILSAIVEELVARRATLSKVAKSIMQPADLDQLCLNGQALNVPNNKVDELLDLMLGKYRTALALSLRSLPLPPGYVIGEPPRRATMSDEPDDIARFQAVWLFCKYDFPDPMAVASSYSEKIQCLLDAGFHGLEQPGSNGETVLYRAFRLLRSPLISEEESVIWLLGHSNEDEFPPHLVVEDRQLPRPTFYVASFLRHVDVAILKDAGVLRPLEKIPRDNCKCFCSTGGCMPHYMFLRCDGNGCRYRARFDACTAERCGIAARDGCLHQWCKAWQLSATWTEQYYQAACRLEIFERLGMQHTCCAAGRRDNYNEKIPDTLTIMRARLNALREGGPDLEFPSSWRRSDDAEREEIQSDDEELKRQLDLIMDFYLMSRYRFRPMPIIPAGDGDYGKSYWASWWKAIDRFLPPLGKEKCVYRGLDAPTRDDYQRNNLFQALDEAYPDKRLMEEQRALTEAGARGKAFDLVIREQLGRFCAQRRSGDSMDLFEGSGN